MRTSVFLAALVTAAMTGVCAAATVNITFEARGLGSTVSYQDVANGFILDVSLSADEPMRAAGVAIDGDPGFAHGGTTRWNDLAVQNYADVPGNGQPPTSTAGWDTSPSSSVELDPGNLPLTGGVNAELGTLAADLMAGAGNGFFAFLEITALPPDAGNNFIITSGASTAIGDLTGNPMTLGTITPLTITTSNPDPGNGDPNGDNGDPNGANGDPPNGGGFCAVGMSQAMLMIAAGLFVIQRRRRFA